MAKPTTRQEFINYCLRRNGFPVIEINVDVEQLEDRVDDALSKYWDYHFDGVEEEHLIVQITNTNISNNYITLDDKVFSVTSILPVGGASTSIGLGASLFSAKHQFYANDLYSSSNIVGSNLQYMSMMKTYLATVDRELMPINSFNFNRKTNKLKFNQPLIDIYEKSKILVLKVYRKLDVDLYPDVWDDEFLKDYAAALIKKQWGSNLSKFGSVNLPGGITLNGDQIYTQALEEITRLEEKLMKDLQLPACFIVG